MLSKLLKYEFRATGRIMLPVYALLLVTAGGTSVTGSLMGRYPESTVLSIFRTLFMTLFAFTTFGVLLLTLVLMVYRFYKNLMTDEGYLMFTLPVSRSQLIWSKLIVSMAWGILSAVLAALMWTMVLSVAGGENLFAGIFRGLRSLMESLSGNATGCIVGLVVLLLAAELACICGSMPPSPWATASPTTSSCCRWCSTSASASPCRPFCPWSPPQAYALMWTPTSGRTRLRLCSCPM